MRPTLVGRLGSVELPNNLEAVTSRLLRITSTCAFSGGGSGADRRAAGPVGCQGLFLGSGCRAPANGVSGLRFGAP